MSSLLKYVERKNTGCYKWDIPTKYKYEKGDSVCMWVADMDFLCAQPITDAISSKLGNYVMGYYPPTDRVKNVIKDWVFKQFGWTIQQDWLSFCPGVCPSFALAIQAFVKPGEKIAVFTPSYHPILYAIEDNGAVLLNSDLIFNKKTHSFEIDWEDLEAKLADPWTKLFINVSPHNPSGRVFTRPELLKIGELCLKYNVLIVTDEIHWDIILKTNSSSSSSSADIVPRTAHIPIASLSKEIADITVTLTSLSKSFNCPSFQFSYCITSNKKLKDTFDFVQKRSSINVLSLFGFIATEAAYTQCDGWYLEVIALIRQNAALVQQEFVDKYPEYVDMASIEGTYLLFIDLREACKKLGFPHNYDFITYKPLNPITQKEIRSTDNRHTSALSDFVYKESGVLLNDGSQFGVAGDGWLRMNLATRRENVLEACRRLGELVQTAVEKLKK